MQSIKKLFFIRCALLLFLLITGTTQGVIIDYCRLRHKDTGRLVIGFGDFHVDIPGSLSLGLRQRKYLKACVEAHKRSLHVSVCDSASAFSAEEVARKQAALNAQEIIKEPIVMHYMGNMIASPHRAEHTVLPGLVPFLQDTEVSVHNAAEDAVQSWIQVGLAMDKLDTSALACPVLNKEGEHVLSDGKKVLRLDPKEQRGLLGLYRIAATKQLRQCSNEQKYAFIHRYMMEDAAERVKSNLSRVFTDTEAVNTVITSVIDRALTEGLLLQEAVNAETERVFLIGPYDMILQACALLIKSGSYEATFIQNNSEPLHKDGVLSVLDLEEAREQANAVVEQRNKTSKSLATE